MQASQGTEQQARIHVASIRSLVAVLTAIKPSGTKQQVLMLKHQQAGGDHSL